MSSEDQHPSPGWPVEEATRSAGSPGLRQARARQLMAVLAGTAVLGLVLWMACGRRGDTSTSRGQPSPLEAPSTSVDSRVAGDPGFEPRLGPVTVPLRSPVIGERDAEPAESSLEERIQGPEGHEELREHWLRALEQTWNGLLASRADDGSLGFGKTTQFFLLAMRFILDEHSLGHPPLGPRVEPPPDTHHLHVNGWDYFVPKGRFPVVDRYYELREEWSRTKPESRGDWLLEEITHPLAADEGFCADLEAIRDQAREAIGRRKYFY